MSAEFPTAAQVLAGAVAGLAVVQLVSVWSGASPETAAFRGVVALIAISVLGVLAQRFLGAPIAADVDRDPAVGSLLDLTSAPDARSPGETQQGERLSL